MPRLAAAIAPAAVRALGRTLRIQTFGSEHLVQARESRRPFLFAVWHGRILLPITRHADEGVLAMVSLSRDGDFTTTVLERLGYAAVRGSSSRGGNAAYHAMVGALTPGRSAAIIPDGPRGPRQSLKPGLIYLARSANALILPLSSSAHPAHCLRSWDRFLLPLPFAGGVIVYGEPIAPPDDPSPSSIERARHSLERTLTELEHEADRKLGRTPVETEPSTAPPHDNVEP